MTDTTGNGFTVKELVVELRRDVKAVLEEMRKKADLAALILLDGRVVALEREQAVSIARNALVQELARKAERNKRWIMGLVFTVITEAIVLAIRIYNDMPK